VADVVVLTETTTEIAPGEENGSRTASGHELGLLAEMRTGARYDDIVACTAESAFTLEAVDAAFPRTEGTVFERFSGFSDLLGALSDGFLPAMLTVLTRSITITRNP